MTLENPFYIWLILAVLFIIVEIFTAGFFYACFAIGALAAMVTGFITNSLMADGGYGLVWQIVIFCAVSVALIPLTRNFARRIADNSVPQAGADALVGLEGIVIEAVNPSDDVGKVKVDGQVWRATASGPIDGGTTIKVMEVRGAKLIVEAVIKNGGDND